MQPPFPVPDAVFEMFPNVPRDHVLRMAADVAKLAGDDLDRQVMLVERLGALPASSSQAVTQENAIGEGNAAVEEDRDLGGVPESLGLPPRFPLLTESDMTLVEDSPAMATVGRVHSTSLETCGDDSDCRQVAVPDAGTLLGALQDAKADNPAVEFKDLVEAISHEMEGARSPEGVFEALGRFRARYTVARVEGHPHKQHLAASGVDGPVPVAFVANLQEQEGLPVQQYPGVGGSKLATSRSTCSVYWDYDNVPFPSTLGVEDVDAMIVGMRETFVSAGFGADAARVGIELFVTRKSYAKQELLDAMRERCGVKVVLSSSDDDGADVEIVRSLRQEISLTGGVASKKRHSVVFISGDKMAIGACRVARRQGWATGIMHASTVKSHVAKLTAACNICMSYIDLRHKIENQLKAPSK